MKDDEAGSAYEVEVATVEELLRLLEERERDDAQGRKLGGIVRNGIFVARLLDQRVSSYGFPSVRRYVVASFIYGRDLISYRRTTSGAVELPEMVGRLEERQQTAYEQIRTEVESSIAQNSIDIAIHEGTLNPLWKAEDR